MAEDVKPKVKAKAPAKDAAAKGAPAKDAPQDAAAPKVRPVKVAAKVAANAEAPKAAPPAPKADPNLLIVDADHAVLGRAATTIAHELLHNTKLEVVVVNAEKAVITGSPVFTLNKFKERRARGKERFGPFYPSRADRIFKRAVRGMLPYQQEKGRAAFKRLRCYHGVPARYRGRGTKIEGAHNLRTAKYLTLQQISESMGV